MLVDGPFPHSLDLASRYIPPFIFQLLAAARITGDCLYLCPVAWACFQSGQNKALHFIQGPRPPSYCVVGWGLVRGLRACAGSPSCAGAWCGYVRVRARGRPGAQAALRSWPRDRPSPHYNNVLCVQGVLPFLIYIKCYKFA